MKQLYKLLLSTFLIFIFDNYIAQVNFDSLWNIWQDTTQKNDTRFRALDDIIWENYVFSNPDSAIILAQLEIEFSKAVGEKNYKAIAYNNIGLSYDVKGDFQKALSTYQKSLAIKEELGDKKGMASTYNNIGIIYKSLGNMAMSLQYHQMCLALHKETGDTNSLGSTYNNIGIIYKVQKNYEKAMEYYLLGLEKRKQENDIKGIAGSFTNIANLFYEKEQYDSSLHYHKKSLEIHQNGNDLQGIAGSYGNMAGLHHALNEDDKAIELFNKSLALSQQIGDKLSIAYAYSNLGIIYNHLEKNNLAIEYLSKSKKLFLDLNTIANLESDCKTLYEIYKSKGNLKKAIENYELHVMFKDSLDKMDANNQLYQFEADKAFEISRLTDSIKYADEIILHQAEAKTQKQRSTGFLIISLIVIISLAIVFKQLKKVKTQKNIIEEKQKEITDSINYAKRLQDGILVPFDLVQTWFSKSFIFFKPKDIVSGDFYWIEKVDKHIYFAVADCTGHGIPGALVSIICSNALSKSLHEDKITSPSKILDNTRKIVEEKFSRSSDNIKDGMDISLCRLNVDTKKLAWAGAMNPLWIVRKESNKIEELKPDRQAVGYTEKPKLFTNQEIQLSVDDSVYIFSDGFQDQFGGNQLKKYMRGKMKKFVLSIQNLSMQEQLSSFDKEFNSWKAKQEQVDDVCVMGVRIT